jgi:hypothetical protein
MAVEPTAPARSAHREHSVVPSFDCVFFRVALLAVHGLSSTPRLVPNRKRLSQSEHWQPARPSVERDVLRFHKES